MRTVPAEQAKNHFSGQIRSIIDRLLLVKASRQPTSARACGLETASPSALSYPTTIVTSLSPSESATILDATS
ncbi:hypothetical protein CCMA1212_004079 [Trichoderma ghanense]|uniref:Uncharacterized protein n=1 Tax=Trichoderma ghanense TaxID=65468 RepID=A0ABY2H6T3_9HYPO